MQVEFGGQVEILEDGIDEGDAGESMRKGPGFWLGNTQLLIWRRAWGIFLGLCECGLALEMPSRGYRVGPSEELAVAEAVLA